jgi:hypothetical protein
MKRLFPGIAVLLALPLIIGSCSMKQEADSVEMSSEALTNQTSLAPTSESAATGIEGKGCTSPYWRCVDDGTAYSSSDDAKTVAQINKSSSGTHTLGFSGGPAWPVTQVVAYYRAATTSSSTKGTIQVNLYDGNTLLKTGTAHSLGSSWANYNDTFSGLTVANVNTLRTSVLLKRSAGSGQVGYTMLWITASGTSACTPGAKQCNMLQPQICDATGAWQNNGTACPYVCNGSTGTCTGTCTPGAKRCNLLQPQTCDATGTWQNTGAACQYTCDPNTATCGGACAPGAVQCNGLQPQTCNATGAWQNNGAVCPYTCSAGICVGVCTPGAVQCNGLQPQTCNATGTWQNSGAACQYTCTAGTCAGSCTPGATRCSSTQPQTCNSSGQWQNNGSACSGCAVCSSSSGTCVAGSCPAPDQCHDTRICSPSTGVCSNPPLTGTSCSDGNACTTGDSCQNGTCVGGTTVTCTAPACYVAGSCTSGACPAPIPAPSGTMDPRCNSLTPYCNSGSCVQCTSDSQCGGTTPSCNPATHTCVCRRPSAGNLLTNPGFDGTLSGWSAMTPPMLSSYSSTDAEACGGSGSVLLTPGSDGDPYQCFSLRGNGSGTYYFGAKFRYVDTWTDAFCTVLFWNDANCTVMNLGTYADHLGPDMQDPNAAPNWKSYSIAEPGPAGAVAASVQCALNTSYGVWIDQIYLNKSANSF